MLDPNCAADERNDITDGTRFVADVDDEVNFEIDASDENCFRDKLGRLHYNRYMSGPTKLVLRAVKFSPSNSMYHVNDMLPLLL